MQKAVQDHGVTFELHSGTVTHGAHSCHLEPAQIDILEHLLDAYPRGVSVAELLNELTNDHVERNEARLRQNLRIQVCRIRRKFWGAGLHVSIALRAGMGRRNEYYLLPGVLPAAPGIPLPGRPWPCGTQFFVVADQELVELNRRFVFDAEAGKCRLVWGIA